ncbi:MAG TPA: efflux RND transporter periplasmic adaptor subunit [Candidatus Angelobacter sp.]|nr:efflux RND transporter periplasmic adaptor subunit [Candidatus Angelobacter sp.]
MKAKKKIILIVAGVVVAMAIVGFSLSQGGKGLVTVQTGKVVKQDIASSVTASGEIKPKLQVNVGANAMGRITHLFVNEGDRVHKGQTLAQLENIQSASDVAAAKAALESSITDQVAAEANFKTSQAALKSSTADAAQKKQDYDRNASLYKAGLISTADYETKKSAYDVASAVMAQDQSRVAQARAQLDSAQGHVAQARAALTHSSDVLSKTTYEAPFAGVVTYIPVHEGETVVMGIQNSPGSTLMTLADMSIITAEVQVDETDIVNVKLGQAAEVTIDAIPGKTFKGEVTEIGDNAIVRSTGLATSQSTSSNQEAKDFKVVVTLKDPPQNVRPGLSTTAKITTGTRSGALTIPIQAITIRDKADLEAQDKTKNKVQPVASQPNNKKKEEVQGVFVILPNKKAEFRQVETGLSGATDIEIKDGLKEGDEIITGTYKVLRTLRNGAGVKVDNSIAAKEES